MCVCVALHMFIVDTQESLTKVGLKLETANVSNFKCVKIVYSLIKFSLATIHGSWRCACNNGKEKFSF